jgi:hypothetical protein
MESLGGTDLRPADGKLFGNRGRAPVGELGALVRIAGSPPAVGISASAANEIESSETSMTADSNFAFSPR